MKDENNNNKDDRLENISFAIEIFLPIVILFAGICLIVSSVFVEEKENKAILTGTGTTLLFGGGFKSQKMKKS